MQAFKIALHRRPYIVTETTYDGDLARARKRAPQIRGFGVRDPFDGS